jgi:nitrile hydratase subunit alpha
MERATMRCVGRRLFWEATSPKSQSTCFFGLDGQSNNYRIFSSLHDLLNRPQSPVVRHVQGTTSSCPRMTSKNAVQWKTCSFSSALPRPPSALRRLPHDVGGDESIYGPIHPNQQNPDDLLEWEQQCHAMFAVLASKHIIRTDELRRTIEGLTSDQQEAFSYYEKWTSAMITLLIHHQIMEQEELENALFGSLLREETRAVSHSTQTPTSTVPLYKVGDFVRVKRYQPTVKGGSSSATISLEWRRPHMRTPGYIYGVAGEIERVCGRFGDPSILAFGLDAPEVQLYRVRFRQRDIWPEQHDSNNSSHSVHGDDVVEVEVYEHWLQPASTGQGHSYEREPLFDHRPTHTPDVPDHGHHHHHHHYHDHEEGNLMHETRDLLEARAATLEGPPRPGEALFRALQKVLIVKEVVTTLELRTMTERLENAGKRLDGATLVARSWVDPAFRQRLIDDAPKAAKELGIPTSNPNAPTVLTVVPNTSAIHNLVVCTLCSCYPSGLLGIAPKWYKSREYRSRAVREPRVVLRDDFGLVIDDSKAIRVHDSTADHRYLVLPERPLGTAGWSEEDLRSLVSRDSMVGVAVAKTPKGE